MIALSAVVIIASLVPVRTLAQDSAEVVILNPIVGDVVDASERDKYKLFGSIKNFSSAIIIRMPNGKFIARITVKTSTGEEITSMEMPEMIIYYIAEKIEHFDELKNGNYVMGSDRRQIIIGKKKVGRQPNSLVTQSETQFEQQKINKDIRVTVTAGNSKQYTGNILFASDSVLMIWRSNEPYRADKLNELAIQLSPIEIEQILIEKEGHFVTGMGTGLLIGGGIGALIGFASGDDEGGFIAFSAATKALFLGIGLGVPSAIVGGISGAAQGIDDDYLLKGDKEKYMEVLPKLKEIALFFSTFPSELKILQLQKKEEISSIISKPILQDSIPSFERSTAKFHISLSGGEMVSMANNNIIDAFSSSGFGGTQYGGWFGPTSYPIDQSIPFFWNVAAEYNITYQMQIGFSRNKFPQQEIHGKNLEYEYANGTSYSVLLGYVLAPVTPLFTFRSEFAIAAGISYNTLLVDGTLSKYSPASIQNLASFAVHKQVFGLHVRGSYDYYFSEYFSLQCKVEGNFMPSVNVPAVNYINPWNEVKNLHSHSVNFSGIDLSFGVRCHL